MFLLTEAKPRGRAVVKGEGLCPRCGGVGVYEYEAQGMAEGEGLLQIRYSFSCPFCGYQERARVILPLRAAYYIRYLLPPKFVLEIEKAWQLLRLKARLDECVGGGCKD